ncbi:glycosyltransferase involved in cell wall biosynthesis [Allocatelliglobosispora scoriae]|uniref:Glycosyltransferase involved in cell wall biosynthesis n=1 Tax=Allocatelliglobosispora scoriae TaxID=643052 RepID=A0A841BTQ3_9ACTN|nr:glycosyltransferase [Allocatelliglobosispora scoriae]MBB5870806.1 glycosyltransferase involved in cell wall biosynthesis [Allocatelliglobosispora scoriae]
MDGRHGRLRVLQVIARMNVGGPAVLAEAACHGLDPDRFEQLILAGQVSADEADHVLLRAPGLPVERIAGLGRAVRPGDDLRALTGLVARMRRFRPHIVHTHAAKAGALGRVAAMLTGVPVIVHTFHGHLLHGYFGPGRTRAVVTAERWLARRTDRLIAVGAQVRDDLLAAGIGTPRGYAVTPPGTALKPLPGRAVARGLLGVPAEGLVVCFVGRLTAIKRIDRLTAAWREIRAALPQASLVVCGDGELLGEIRAAGLPGVHLLGWRADVETVYAAADVALLTSDNEGMPLCLVEAALAGLPAVTTGVGSAAEVVVDGVTGVVCPTDAGALARAVVRVLTEPGLRERMGTAARELAQERFTAARFAEELDRIYTTLAAARGIATAPSRELVG